MDFATAFARLLEHEGGYTDDPRDRGNWTGGEVGKGECRGTKYGISAAAYPHEDIRNMTPARVRELYFSDYWGPAGCDAVPPEVKGDLFDAAVNSGVRSAIRMLQRAAGEAQDGVLGPRTLQAVQSMPAEQLRGRLAAARLLHMTEARTWPAYGRGWTRRVALDLLGE